MPKAKVRIVSYSREAFQDRTEAGIFLAREMMELKGKNAVVLGIPRGGIMVARSLAQAIDADIDIVLSRKLGAPYQQELAIGALSEHGELFLNKHVVELLNVPSSYIEQEKARQVEEIRRRNQLIRSVKTKVPLNNRIVIVTDDGIATGATMQAAVWAIRDEKPQKIIIAVPVASEEAVTRLAEDVDEIVCLRMPVDFAAVGQFYIEFTQVTDEEVVEVLKEKRTK